MITIKEILQQQGLASNEINTRFKNKQILINGEPCLDLKQEINLVEKIDLPEFGFMLLSNGDDISFNQLLMFGADNLYNSNINNKFVDWWNNNTILIKFSKKDTLLIRTTNISWIKD